MARLRRGRRAAPPAWRDYASQLRKILRAYGAQILVRVRDRWPSWSAGLAHSVGRHDAAGDINEDLDSITLEFAQSFEPLARDAARAQGRKVNVQNRAASNRSAKTLIGIEPFGVEGWSDEFVNLFVEGNAGLIKSIAQTQAQQIGQIVRDGLLSGDSLANVSKAIEERTGVAESRAVFLARDQTAKLNSQLGAERMRKIGVEKYEWSTSRDERVRENHRSKEGKIYSFNDPPADTGNPGEDYNCRCVAIPVFDDDEAT